MTNIMSILDTIWAVTTPLEWSAMFFTTVCIFLAGRNNVHTWWTGLVGCVLYGILFYQYRLFADTTLQVFFVGTGIIGWLNWTRTRKSGLVTPEPDISKVGFSTLAKMFGVAIIVAAIYSTILSQFTVAYSPGIDSAILTLSVVAQLLLMRRRIETWAVWLIVNTMAVPLFFTRELYLTSAFYALFWLHAWYAWWQWNKIYQSQK